MISTVAYHYTVIVSILILLIDSSNMHIRENWRGQTGENPVSGIHIAYAILCIPSPAFKDV
jgi:hypothetical protein